jgi:hypothetical protein
MSNYITEFVYAGVGALLGYLLMKMDDTLNNKQYTYKEYCKFTLGCYLATLTGLILLRIAGPVKLPGTGIGTPILMQTGGTGSINHAAPPTLTTMQSVVRPASIPSSGTAFFQPANGGGQSLRFAAGTPTF